MKSIVHLAGRYGYRRVTALLREAGPPSIANALRSDVYWLQKFSAFKSARNEAQGGSVICRPFNRINELKHETLMVSLLIYALSMLRLNHSN